MSFSSSKENILKKIRKALSHSTPLPFPKSDGNNPVFQPLQQEIEVEFAEQFIDCRVERSELLQVFRDAERTAEVAKA